MTAKPTHNGLTKKEEQEKKRLEKEASLTPEQKKQREYYKMYKMLSREERRKRRLANQESMSREELERKKKTNLKQQKRRWEMRQMEHDPMEVVICKSCNHLEYWGKMTWFEGKVLCRDCYIREFIKIYGRPPENIDPAEKTPSIIE